MAEQLGKQGTAGATQEAMKIGSGALCTDVIDAVSAIADGEKQEQETE